MKKKRLHHFLSNLFTTLNFEILEDDISSAQKERLLGLVRIASLMVAYEEVLLGGSPKFFIKEVSIDDVLDRTLPLFEKKAKSLNVDISLPYADSMIHIDEHYFCEALSSIVNYLLQDCSFLKFKYNENKNSLEIYHDSNDVTLSDIENIFDYMDTKNVFNQKLSFQFALKLLDSQKIKTEISDGKIAFYLN